MDRYNGSNSSNQGRKLTTNTGDAHRTDHMPPPPDESYWAALLREGEVSTSKPQRLDDSAWTGYESDLPAMTQATPDGGVDDWDAAQQAYEQDRAIELTVIGYNRGGLLVEWNSLRGFVPASQLVDFPATLDGQARRSELADRVGHSLTLRVIELSREQNRLVLSERAAQVLPGARAGILDRLRKGDTAEGHVTNLCDFGAFVDLGGLEGLIHISELSWGRVGHPRDILTRGQTIRVHVMDVTRDQGRIALSLKRLQPDPWETVAQRYQIGQIVEGVVTNVVDFGAFACVEEGLEGLIHVSELAEGNFLHPRNVVKEGDRVHARILNINGQARRLGLSLRQPEQDIAAEIAVVPTPQQQS